MAEIEISERTADWLRDAEPDVRNRILKKLRSIKDFPDHYLKWLSGSPYYRLWIGDYRAIIDWRRDEDSRSAVHSAIDHRDSVYE